MEKDNESSKTMLIREKLTEAFANLDSFQPSLIQKNGHLIFSKIKGEKSMRQIYLEEKYGEE